MKISKNGMSIDMSLNEFYEVLENETISELIGMLDDYTDGIFGADFGVPSYYINKEKDFSDDEIDNMLQIFQELAEHDPDMPYDEDFDGFGGFEIKMYSLDEDGNMTEWSEEEMKDVSFIDSLKDVFNQSAHPAYSLEFDLDLDVDSMYASSEEDKKVRRILANLGDLLEE